ncbi:MAG: PGPGW domain-containing protein [Pseudomonadota bacterium]
MSMLFIVTLVISVVAVPYVIVRIPADYFRRDKPHHHPFRDATHPLKLLRVLGKNLLGLVLVGVGLALLVLPGQGVLVILIGVFLLDFPGKHKVERWLISRGPILKVANWLRAKGHKKPLVLD